MKPPGDSTPPVQYHETQYEPGHTPDETGPPRWPHSGTAGQPGRVSILVALGAWKLEAIAVVLAVGFLAAIFITLSHFDGQDVPNWPVSLNLNSLVAIYATILRALLLFAMAEVLSQEKWYWFRRPRPLRHLDDFDLASRGVLGSLKLIPVAFSSIVPLAAAITTIVLLAIGPFTQQSVKTTLCRRVLDRGDPVLIPIAAKLPSRDVGVRNNVGPLDLPASALNAVRAGLTTPNSGSTFNLPFECPTGNCTFPEFKGITHSSLGLCSACEDVTPTVVELPKNCPTTGDRPTYTLCEYEVAPPYAPKTKISPADVRFQIVPSYPKVHVENSVFRDDVPFDWVNITLLTRSLAGCDGDNGRGGCLNTPKYPHLPGLQNPNDFNFTIVAARCGFYPCLKHYRGSIRGGALLETVVSTTKLAPNYTTPTSIDLAAVADPCLAPDGTWHDAASLPGSVPVNGSAASPAPPACVYKLPNTWMYLMAKELNATLAGTCTPVTYSKAGFLPHHPTWCNEAWWLGSLWNNGSATYEGVAGIFDNVAAGVTNYMRGVGLRWDAVDNSSVRPTEADRAFVGGTAEQTDLCIQFDWMWLLLPTGLTLITVALLVAEVVKTYLGGGATPAWKSSLLPLLFHGFRGGVEGVPPDHRMGPGELGATAKGMVARYVPDERGGCGIVLENGGGGVKRRHGGGYKHIQS
ncbi:hypothetical protein QBC39DRAFT_252942 [Podospora conica]|nr:hypothetical protein QBC39DRAFT_252942 [Schizothecium conicum]